MSEHSPYIEPSTIRRLADGELEPQQRAELEASGLMEEAERQATFERKLRVKVCDVMKRTPAPPTDLRDRVQAAMRSDAVASAEPVGRIGAAGRQPVPSEARRKPFVRANIFAVAASLMLVASAVLFGIFGKPIDAWFQPSVAGATEIAEFVTGEHDRVARNPEARNRKIDYTDPAQARAAISELLGLTNKSITVFDLRSDGLNYEFVGGGKCGMGHCDDSAHLVYRRSGPRGPAMASVFIGHNYDRSFAATQPGNWQELELTARCTHKVFYSTDGSLVYLLVCCDSSDMPKLAMAIGEQLKAVCSSRSK